MGHQIIPWILDYHKKFPSKNLPNTEKMGITAKKCEILYSITTKMTCIIRKLTKTEYKTFKQFFDPSNIL
jgi:hypothetical protein